MIEDKTQEIDIRNIFNLEPTIQRSIVDEVRKRNLLKVPLEDFCRVPGYRVAVAVVVYKEAPNNAANAWMAAAIAFGDYVPYSEGLDNYFTMCRDGELDPALVYTRLAERGQHRLTPGYSSEENLLRVPGR